MKKASTSVMLVGCTGCGKSTLINAICNKNVIKEFLLPQTNPKPQYYISTNPPINFFELPGWTIFSEENDKTWDAIFKIINTNELFDQPIRLAWYCVNCEGSRFQPMELECISKLRSIGINVIVVFTQCVSHKLVERLENNINIMFSERGLSVPHIYPVLAKERIFTIDNNSYFIRKHGVEELVSYTLSL